MSEIKPTEEDENETPADQEEETEEETPPSIRAWKEAGESKGLQIFYGLVFLIVGGVLAFDDYVLWEDNVFPPLTTSVIYAVGIYLLYMIVIRLGIYSLLWAKIQSHRVEYFCIAVAVLASSTFVYYQVNHLFTS